LRAVAVLTALAAVLVLAGAGQTRDTQESKKPVVISKPDRCPDAVRAIVYYRSETWEHQDFLGEQRYRTNHPERLRHACGYKRWSAERWQGRHTKYHKIISKLQDHTFAICYVFGQYCRQALAVARCESGHSYSIHAQNGQYLGMFQMGSSERRIYGHGDTAYEQAVAAHRYFVASGRDWSPWSCRYAIYS